jgi:hypothetical protein
MTPSPFQFAGFLPPARRCAAPPRKRNDIGGGVYPLGLVASFIPSCVHDCNQPRGGFLKRFSVRVRVQGIAPFACFHESRKGFVDVQICAGEIQNAGG